MMIEVEPKASRSSSLVISWLLPWLIFFSFKEIYCLSSELIVAPYYEKSAKLVYSYSMHAIEAHNLSLLSKLLILFSRGISFIKGKLHHVLMFCSISFFCFVDFWKVRYLKKIFLPILNCEFIVLNEKERSGLMEEGAIIRT